MPSRSCLGPPSLYQTMLARADLGSRRLASLRLAVTGAAAIPVELVGRMRDDIGFRTVLTGYGLTEATGVSTLCREGDDPETIATTSGRAIPDVDVRVVDDDGREVASRLCRRGRRVRLQRDARLLRRRRRRPPRRSTAPGACGRATSA